jgi:hypothetical protein
MVEVRNAVGISEVLFLNKSPKIHKALCEPDTFLIALLQCF